MYISTLWVYVYPIVFGHTDDVANSRVWIIKGDNQLCSISSLLAPMAESFTPLGTKLVNHTLWRWSTSGRQLPSSHGILILRISLISGIHIDGVKDGYPLVEIAPNTLPSTVTICSIPLVGVGAGYALSPDRGSGAYLDQLPIEVADEGCIAGEGCDIARSNCSEHTG